MTLNKPYYITTAIAYPNGPPHIGHAYELAAADAIARFRRLEGREVRFMTGTDEYGLKMLQTAKAQGTTPEALADANVPRFRDLVAKLDATPDRFLRTSEPAHHAAVQEVWRRMEARGDIYASTYAGWYSVRDEAYFGEDEITRTEGGKAIAPTGAPLEWMEEESSFFRLSAYQDKLLALYEARPDFVAPVSRRNEVVSFVKSGLRDLSISRANLEWGVPAPREGHVVYVWLDALSNYISGLGFPDEDTELWQQYWPCDLHLVGKDIMRFHAIYWPAFLMSAGLEVPRSVFGHGFLNVDGAKMSKSEGNVVDPIALIDEFGPDQIRYAFLRETPFGADGAWSRATLVARINADLANDLGNLAQRSLTMTARRLGGRAPDPREGLGEADAMLTRLAWGLAPATREIMTDLRLDKVLAEIMMVVAAANRRFSDAAPWKMEDDDPALPACLYATLETLRCVAICLAPFIPRGATRLLDFLASPEDARDLASACEAKRLTPGLALPAPEPLFPRAVPLPAKEGA